MNMLRLYKRMMRAASFVEPEERRTWVRLELRQRFRQHRTETDATKVDTLMRGRWTCEREETDERI